jgi:hypothetical protein
LQGIVNLTEEINRKTIKDKDPMIVINALKTAGKTPETTEISNALKIKGLKIKMLLMTKIGANNPKIAHKSAN